MTSYNLLRDKWVRSGDPSALAAMLEYVRLEPLSAPVRTSSEIAAERKAQRLTAFAASLARWRKRLTAILVLCLLGLAVTWGINWLSHQPWGGSGGQYVSCPDGGILTWHSLKDGDMLFHCR